MAFAASQALYLTRSAWGGLMAELREGVAPKDGYPQLNVNTGVSIGLAVMLAGSIYWSAGLKSDVGHHADRLSTAEGAIKELRVSLDSVRLGQAQSEIKLEGRLVGIEVLLRQVIDRLERDRRGNP